MRREPRVRKDGACALRECGRPLPRLAVLHGDPFHSSECARSFHGVVYAPDHAGKKRKPTSAQRAYAVPKRRRDR